jgi:pimeloyl-ACP methyl ester carboxylesterase
MPQTAAMTLVLLPGLDGTGDLFEPLLSQLPPKVSPKVVHYPADRLLSYAELLAHVEEHLPIENPYIVLAESFSAPLGVSLAAHHPRNLRGLILWAGFVTNPARGLLRLLQALALPFWFRLGIPAAAVNHFLIGRNAPPELHQLVVRTIQRVRPATMVARIRFVAGCDVRRELAEVSVPTLYLQATDDRLVTPRSLEEIQKEKPGIQAVQIDGPHFLLQREPGRVTEIIAAFVRQVCF